MIQKEQLRGSACGFLDYIGYTITWGIIEKGILLKRAADDLGNQSYHKIDEFLDRIERIG